MKRRLALVGLLLPLALILVFGIAGAQSKPELVKVNPGDVKVGPQTEASSVSSNPPGPVVVAAPGFRLEDNSGVILLEDGSRLLLE